MAFLSWHERYSVGHSEIDGQHKHLFDLVNQFNDPGQVGTAAGSNQAMENLITASAMHFKAEEALMAEVSFPGLPEHERMHEDLLKQLLDLQAKMKVGGHVGMVSISRFLADWLVNHIVREDREYRPFLNPS